jgi:hypothetical protein
VGAFSAGLGAEEAGAITTGRQPTGAAIASQLSQGSTYNSLAFGTLIVGGVAEAVGIALMVLGGSP